MKKPTVRSFLGEGVNYHSAGTCAMTKGDNRMILDVRGLGEIQYLFDTLEQAYDFQDELGRFIVDAINMKIKVNDLKEKQRKTKK